MPRLEEGGVVGVGALVEGAQEEGAQEGVNPFIHQNVVVLKKTSSLTPILPMLSVFGDKASYGG